MTSSETNYHSSSQPPSSVLREEHIESGFISKLQGLKYEIRPDIRDRASLEANFRGKFEALNRVRLTDSEFARLLDEIVTPDVFVAAKNENHKAIKEFFPKAQLFGFTGTPIFEENAAQQKITDTQASMKTTDDLFQKRLHAYTITHAIEDGNVLRFHIDFFKPEEEKDKKPPKPGSSKTLTSFRAAPLRKDDPNSMNHKEILNY